MALDYLPRNLLTEHWEHTSKTDSQQKILPVYRQMLDMRLLLKMGMMHVTALYGF